MAINMTSNKAKGVASALALMGKVAQTWRAYTAQQDDTRLRALGLQLELLQQGGVQRRHEQTLAQNRELQTSGQAFRSREAALQRGHETGERVGGQDFRSLEAASDRNLRRDLQAGDIAARADLQDDAQDFTTGENDAAMNFDANERNLSRIFQATEGDLNRAHDTEESAADRAFRAEEGEKGRTFQAGENELEIRVANTWHNRLVSDASRPPEERRSHVSQSYRFEAGAPPHEAGLLGPVRIKQQK